MIKWYAAMTICSD